MKKHEMRKNSLYKIEKYDISVVHGRNATNFCMLLCYNLHGCYIFN